MSRVLIVEDEPSVAQVIQDYLDSLGFETDSVSNGAEAIDRAQKEHPDLIIMDLMMPRLTGGEAARLLKRNPGTADIPILAISGMSEAEQFGDILAVDAILPKPFDLQDLGRQVTELLPKAHQQLGSPGSSLHP
ncbi:MAG: response regulator [Thermomicrobiaceae bacterium]|nr:response regulator [Thermomicrobiaceae bacterium]